MVKKDKWVRRYRRVMRELRRRTCYLRYRIDEFQENFKPFPIDEVHDLDEQYRFREFFVTKRYDDPNWYYTFDCPYKMDYLFFSVFCGIMPSDVNFYVNDKKEIAVVGGRIPMLYKKNDTASPIYPLDETVLDAHANAMQQLLDETKMLKRQIDELQLIKNKRVSNLAHRATGQWRFDSRVDWKYVDSFLSEDYLYGLTMFEKDDNAVVRHLLLTMYNVINSRPYPRLIDISWWLASQLGGKVLCK